MVVYDPQIPILLVLKSESALKDTWLPFISNIRPEKLYVYIDASEAYIPQQEIEWSCLVKIKCSRKPQGYDRALLAANKWFFAHEFELMVTRIGNVFLQLTFLVFAPNF